MAGPPELPEGTVTVLSTDLVGSTALNQRLGDEVAMGIEREVEALALEQVGRQRGVVIKETGDGLMVAFQSARRAVACAQEIQRALARHNRVESERAVELRIGLHTGEVLADDGDLHGETILVAKRIEESALPGTIFASDTVHGVLGTARSELEDRGEFELKGITQPCISSRCPGPTPPRPACCRAAIALPTWAAPRSARVWSRPWSRQGAEIASWGYGFTVESTTKWPWFHGSLQSLGTLSHGGGGGAKIWIDRDREIVGVYFEACLRGDEEAGEHYWNVDLFENLVTSAWDGA